MFLVFEAIFVGATPLMQWIDAGKEWLSEQIRDAMSPGPVRSLITDGMLKGVGGVLQFLPQIMILFGFIAILEDCGYMARAAFLMDKIMSKCGLNGKSFIPLLSSVACAVPGDHGHARDRKPTRSARDHRGCAFDELFSPFAALHAAHCRVSSRSLVVAWSGLIRNVFARACDRTDRGPDAEEDTLAEAQRPYLYWRCRASNGRNSRQFCAGWFLPVGHSSSGPGL